MNINESLKSELLKVFSSEKSLKKAVDNFEIYRFFDFSSLQIMKVFDVENENIFSESNSKKHLTKVSDMIKSEFFCDRTSDYFNVFYNPIKDKKMY